MTHTRVSILLASGALLIASAASAQQRMKGSGIPVRKEAATSYPDLNERNMTALMASGDSLEVEIGQLAHEKGSDQRVRGFGLMLANDHTAHLARTLEMTFAGFEPIRDDVSTQRLRELLSWLQANPPGVDWDARLLRALAQHHQRVMEILSHNIENIHDHDFEDHFKKTLTSLAKHRDVAKSIATTLGVSLP